MKRRCKKCGEILVKLSDGTYDCRCARLEADSQNEDYPGLEQNEDQNVPDENIGDFPW